MRVGQSAAGSTKQYVLIISLVVLAAFVHYYTYSKLQLRCRENSIKELKRSLKRVFLQIDSLKKNHSRLILRLNLSSGLIKDSFFKNYSLASFHLEKKSPTEEYETLRHRIYSSTKELWYYVNHQLRRLLHVRLSEQRRDIVKELADRKRWMLSEQEKLPQLDGHEEWRRQEASSVSDLVQRRLNHLQNPPNCRAARKLLCRHDGILGFGCNFHHLVYCLAIAYAYKRTLIVVHYNKHPMNKWTNIFQPLSETCTKCDTKNVSFISLTNDNATTVRAPRIYKINSLTKLPHQVPKEFAQRIARFNGDPYSWWIGQMVKYILKLQRKDVINATISKINFTLPIVGVHIRRSDKLIYEAKYIHIDEYMAKVDDFYTQLEMTRAVEQRRVYLATDDLNVLKDAIVRYPQYAFYGNYYRAETAAVETRFSTEGLSGFLMDVYMLSLCHHVVCTFSSNIGRLAYEFMQSRRIHAFNHFTSLDQPYHFSNRDTCFRMAVISNKNISFNVGDLISYNCVTGISTVLRTKEVGHIPWYKTNEYFA